MSRKKYKNRKQYDDSLDLSTEYKDMNEKGRFGKKDDERSSCWGGCASFMGFLVGALMVGILLGWGYESIFGEEEEQSYVGVYDVYFRPIGWLPDSIGWVSIKDDNTVEIYLKSHRNVVNDVSYDIWGRYKSSQKIYYSYEKSAGYISKQSDDYCKIQLSRSMCLGWMQSGAYDDYDCTSSLVIDKQNEYMYVDWATFQSKDQRGRLYLKKRE